MNNPPIANRLDRVLPGLFRWEVYSPEHKVELTSHAVVANGRLYCFDPVPLVEELFDFLARQGNPAATILTNDNHERDCRLWSERWSVPVMASADAKLAFDNVKRFESDQSEWEGWRLHRLDGGGGGELAFRLPELDLVVFGDAVVNLPSRGLELLPAKYCRDQAAMKERLRVMAAEPFAAMVMAHGVPVLRKASERLTALL